jgi:NAD(P)H dehydrogenase (quinone)
MLASGMGHWEADGVLEQFDWIRAGGADSVTGTVSEVTGSDPRPIEDWLADRRATFLAPPLDLPPPTG